MVNVQLSFYDTLAARHVGPERFLWLGGLVSP
jgi:hypothetical protein